MLMEHTEHIPVDTAPDKKGSQQKKQHCIIAVIHIIFQFWNHRCELVFQDDPVGTMDGKNQKSEYRYQKCKPVENAYLRNKRTELLIP